VKIFFPDLAFIRGLGNQSGLYFNIYGKTFDDEEEGEEED